MKRAWFLVASFFLILAPLGASPLRHSEVFFMPSNSYVGDLVEMKVPLLEVPPAFNFNFEADEETLSTFLEIREVTYDARASLITIYFVSYSVGRQFFPVLSVGSGYTLEGLAVTTSSLVEEATRLAPFKKTILVSGTEILFFLLIMAILGLPLAFLKGMVSFRRFVKRKRGQYLYYKPYRQFVREMENLRSLIKGPSAYEFFARLDQVLRLFLSLRLKENFGTYTTREMKHYLREKNIFSFQESEMLIDLFRMSDLVKFADHQIDIKTREIFWQDVMNLTQKFEKERGGYVNL
jgi:hypothetical protein